MSASAMPTTISYCSAAVFRSFDAYQASGNAQSVASGRLSYLLGSARAVHDDRYFLLCVPGCDPLRRVRACACGESSMALAGGVNLICAPEHVDRAVKRPHAGPRRALQDFRYGRGRLLAGEGCGMVVLKRLLRRKARRRSDPGCGARQRYQSGRQEQRSDRAERSSAGIRHPRRARSGAS